MNHKLAFVMLGAAAALAGCVGGGPITKDWAEESRAASRRRIAASIAEFGWTVPVLVADDRADPADLEVPSRRM